MKILKKSILVLVIYLLTSINFVANAEDCSDYRLFSHKWNMCKFGNVKEGVSNLGESSESKATEGNTESTEKKKDGILGKLFQKPSWMK